MQENNMAHQFVKAYYYKDININHLHLGFRLAQCFGFVNLICSHMWVLFPEKIQKNKVLQMHVCSLGIFKISFIATLAHVLQSYNDLGKSSGKRQQEASFEAPWIKEQ